MDAGNDILIRLYGIRDYSDAFRALKEKGIVIKRVMDVNDSEVVDFVKTNFSAVWAEEVRFALFHRNCHVAVEGTKIVGFFCIQATAPEFFGPVGVLPEYRGKGIASALLHRAVLLMKDRGYKYMVSGATRGPMARIIRRYYASVELSDSIGSYEDLLDPSIVD